jgi:hypothetical protein
VSAVEVNGNACSAAVLTVPGAGLWYAGVDLAEAVELEGTVTLTFLDTTWSGYVISGGIADGRARYRIVAGAGGWGRTLPAKAYANDAGLLVSRIVTDVATAAGETLDTSTLPSTRLGPHFSRPRAPASFALNLLAPRAWYADADGAVAFGARPEADAPAYPTLARNPASRVVELGLTDSASGVLPGASTEYGTAADVELELSEEGLRARLYAAPVTSRRLAAYARIIEALDPAARYRGVWDYRVVTQEGERLNLQPIYSRADLPDLARVPVRAGVPGVRAQHTPGSRDLVAFPGGDLSRPCVVGFDSPDQPGWMPLSLELGGPGALGVARRTDAVQAGPFAGVITGASARVKAVV